MPLPRLILAALLLPAVALAGCRASAGADRLLAESLAPQSVEVVELHFDDPQRPYTAIADIWAEADTRSWSSLADAEAEAYEGLRRQAARHGALAVVNINRVVLRDGEPIAVREPIDPTPATERYVVRATGRAVIFRDRDEPRLIRQRPTEPLPGEHRPQHRPSWR
jgi:hypothetical protein